MLGNKCGPKGSNRGLEQGSSLTPILFKVYPSSLHNISDKESDLYTVRRRTGSDYLKK